MRFVQPTQAIEDNEWAPITKTPLESIVLTMEISIPQEEKRIMRQRKEALRDAAPDVDFGSDYEPKSKVPKTKSSPTICSARVQH